jgi:hypothetical protein
VALLSLIYFPDLEHRLLFGPSDLPTCIVRIGLGVKLSLRCIHLQQAIPSQSAIVVADTSKQHCFLGLGGGKCLQGSMVPNSPNHHCWVRNNLARKAVRLVEVVEVDLVVEAGQAAVADQMAGLDQMVEEGLLEVADPVGVALVAAVDPLVAGVYLDELVRLVEARVKIRSHYGNHFVHFEQIPYSRAQDHSNAVYSRDEGGFLLGFENFPDL